ncbi:hypothetical protein P872_05760 [Rhodonellum psychrophilum GCM71 = DSM 17998]|uniref:DNA alkylation repair protein n=2 Tax=Rhodonellum TaxID=336827 RepID=U5BPN2_9BACT|nr:MULTISPECIES: DNA alkylation repair protein [Rhodonellum]ERM82530.1 hypothetical protein P872_05760 [Rhodonellum psychrophilum GCM71 = DSM 17998]SDY54495.1 3-methyladenine DNA glycosylase AlkD [Rhodonellum ikkaensis]
MNENHLTEQILLDLQALADPKKAEFLPKFFKVGPGQYGEGDLFMGVTVPHQRKIATKYWKEISKEALSQLLHSPYHEARLTALFVLVKKFEKAKSDTEKQDWMEFYLKHRSGVNSWDLVDSSAPKILGEWLFDKNRSLLFDFATTGTLWEKRMAMISTLYFIRKMDFEDTFKIAEILLRDSHDLIHKVIGWMIREVGNRDMDIAFAFLKKHYKIMPRTMLRYAIEKNDPDVREAFLKGAI